MDFLDNLCLWSRPGSALAIGKGQLHLRGPGYGQSKIVTVRHFLSNHFQTAITLVWNEIFQKLKPSTMSLVWTSCTSPRKRIKINWTSGAMLWQCYYMYSLGHITCPVLFIHFFWALKSQFDTFFWSKMIGLGLQFPILVLDLNFVQNMVEL